MANTKITSRVIADNSVGISALNVTDGTNGQYLQTDGAGTLSFSTVSAGPTFKTFGTDSIMIGDTTTGTIDAADNNVGVGVDVFAALTSGDDNVAIGKSAMTANTTGIRNTAVGANALDACTEGGANTAVGLDALGDLTTGSENTAVGWTAGGDITTASFCTAVGRQALRQNTTTEYLTAVGYSSMRSTTGIANTAVGNSALYTNTTGRWNTAVGDNALYNHTTPDGNDAFGYNAGKSISTGGVNVVIGSFSMDSGGAQTGGANTHIGHAGARSLTSGHSNTSCGIQSLYAITTGLYNACIGRDSGGSITTGSNNICIGYAAGLVNQPGGAITTGSNQIVVGNSDSTNAHIQIDWTVASDKRDKTDVTPLDMGLSFINKLEPVTYKWDKRAKYEEGKTPDGTHKESWTDVGFLAQDVEKIEAEFGHKIEDETNLTTYLNDDGNSYGLTYTKFIPILVKSVQELSTQVNELKSELLTLKGE